MDARSFASSSAGEQSPASSSCSRSESRPQAARTSFSRPTRCQRGSSTTSDPYRDELLETARLVAERAGVEDWSFSFQSASPTGEPWLGPDIVEHLGALAAAGVRDVLLCPVGFVSDHLEIRWDLDTVAAEAARELGIRLERIEMPNADPAFVRVLAGLVRHAAAVPSVS